MRKNSTYETARLINAFQGAAYSDKLSPICMSEQNESQN